MSNVNEAADELPDWDVEGESTSSDDAFAERDAADMPSRHPARTVDAYAPLRAMRRWLVAKIEPDDNGKPTKVPYCAHDTRRNAAVNDPSTWCDFETACSLVERDPTWMLGFVIGGSGFVVIDFDHCRDPHTGAVDQWAVDLFAPLGVFLESSVSETGVHGLARGSLPTGRRRTGNNGKCTRVPAGSEVEMYDSGRFIVMTARPLPESAPTIPDRTKEIAALHAVLFPASTDEKQHVANTASALKAIPDEELLRRARTAKKTGKKFDKLWNGDTSAHGGDDSAADAALCAMLAFWTGHDHERIDRLFRQSKLCRPKWIERKDYRESTIALACKKTSVYGGTGSARRDGVSIEDFTSYLPQRGYIFAPTGELWPAASVNARVRPVAERGEQEPTDWIAASAWLDKHRSVEQMTWAPGYPQLIKDRLFSQGGQIVRPGCNTFNLYRPPQVALGDARLAEPWRQLVHTLYGPEDGERLIAWCAQRVQHPEEKINHGLLLGGVGGIGKDSLLEPVKHAVGPWNFSEVSPTDLFEPFNPFVKCVIMRISEARDMGDVNRYGFYEHMKTLLASPPDVLRVNDKNLREYVVTNVCGVIFTTNHRTEALYLPADDRRHHVLWSERKPTDFPEGFFDQLWQWYANGGIEHVAAYLASYDLSSFNPKAPPPKTPAFWDVVAANRAPENADLADALDSLKQPDALTPPDAVTLQQLIDSPNGTALTFLTDRKYARQIPHRLSEAGYVQHRNAAAKDGLWKICGRRQVVYVRQELSLRERSEAVQLLLGPDASVPHNAAPLSPSDRAARRDTEDF